MTGITRSYIKSPLLMFIGITIISAFWFQLFSPIPNRWDAIPTYDSVFFIKMAESILPFREFGWIGYHEPCFYPILTALLTLLTGDLYQSAVLISKASVTILPGIIYLFARDLFSEKVGITSALLILFYPHIKAIAGVSQSEALYVSLITLSAYLLWKAWQKQSFPTAAVAGIFFVLSYLTRSEGVITLLFMAFYLVVVSKLQNRPLRKAVATITVVLLVFGALSAPYISHLSRHYGTFTIGTKTSGIYFWVRSKCFNDPDPDRTEWGLSPQGELNVISMRSRDLLAYWGRDIPRSVGVYLKNFSEQIPGLIPNDGGIKHYPQVYPLYLAIPLIIGLILRIRRRESFTAAGFLLSPFLMLFIYPLLTGGWWRYLINMLPFFVILAAVSLESITIQLARWLPSRGQARSVWIVWAALILITSYHVWVVKWKASPQSVVTYGKDKAQVSDEIKKAGAWARKIIPPSATFMAQWTRLPYYLPGRWVAMPEADLDGVLYYARKNRTSYLLIESNDAITVSQLASNRIPGLSYEGTYASSSIDYYCTIMRLY